MSIPIKTQPKPDLPAILAKMRQTIEQNRAQSAAEIARDAGPLFLPGHPLPKSIDSASVVKIWPVMARLAIGGGFGPELRLWVVAQWLVQHGGNGWVTFAELVEATQLSGNTVRRLLETGSIFWRGTTGSGSARRIYIAGQVEVEKRVRSLAHEAGLFDSGEPERCRWQVTIDDCTGSLVDFYAACFKGWIGNRSGFEYRITWAVLQSAWNKSRTQINEWIDIAGLQKIANWGAMAIPADWQDHLIAIEDQFTVPYGIGHYERSTFAYYRRANSYKTQERWRKVTARGKWYKIGRTLDSAGVSGGQLGIVPHLPTAHDHTIAGSASERSVTADYCRHNFTRADAYLASRRKRHGYAYLMSGQSRRGSLWEYARPE